MRPRRLWLLLLVGLWGCTTPPEFPPSPDGVASVSSPIALSPDGRTLWVVNPDADSVTRVDVRTLTVSAPVPVGREPWAVAVTPSNLVVVMNRLGGSLSLLEGNGRYDILIGPEPGGVALSPTGRHAYVTVSSADEVAVVDLHERRVTERIPVGRMPWSVAVTDNGNADDNDESIIVSHRLSRSRPGGQEATNDGKEAWLTVIEQDGVKEVVLAPHDFGFPNVLEGLAVLDNKVWVSHLLNKPELPRDFENTVSGALSTISLTSRTELTEQRLHLNDPDFSTPTNFPRAVAVTPDGTTALVVLAGTNAVMGIDLRHHDGPKLLGFWAAGTNPRGIVLNRDATRAYVMNYLSRDISVLDLEDRLARREIIRVPVAPEVLEPELLRGKVLFNNANDPRISHLGWISCASCHPDGGADNTTWITPEGHRQTMPLWELEGTAPFHIAATRDEIQDFEEDIETFMGGTGLAPGLVTSLLGEPNGGKSVDLDALAAYALKGIRVPQAPEIEAQAEARGREAFTRNGCATCHGGPAWTRSSLPGPPGTLAPDGEEVVREVLHDVGTYSPTQDMLGSDGFDIPSLLGLHATAPYFHDGSAPTLEDVLAHQGHSGPHITAKEITNLATFLRSIDAKAVPFN